MPYKLIDGTFDFWTASHGDGSWDYIFRVPVGRDPNPWVPVMHAANSSTTYKPLPCRRSSAEDIELWLKANPKYRTGSVAAKAERVA